MLERLRGFADRYELRIVFGLLAFGYVIRIVWLFLKPEERLVPHQSEMWLVTEHWTRTGQLADAYGEGSGISSHVGPVNVVIAGLVYRLFGTGTLTSELLLSLISGTYVVLLFWFLYRIASELDIPGPARMLGLLMVILVPFEFYWEVVDFRVREGLLAAMLLAGLLWWSLVLDRRGSPSLRELFLYGLASGFAFLVHPAVALAAYLLLGLVILRHVPARRWPAVAAILAIGFGATNGAWIARNYVIYDRFMPSRGNLWLEVTTSNQPSSLDAKDPRAAFQANMKRIHPRFSEEAFMRYKTFPRDVDYFDHLGRETRAWIVEHPLDFARLLLRHFREFWFPPLWLYDLYGQDPPTLADRVKQAWHWSMVVAALAGLIIGLRGAPRRHLFVILSLVPLMLLYSLVQPTVRYRYMMLGILTFLAASGVWQLLGRPLIGRLLGWRRSATAG